jgi:hypothetical protein
MCIAKIPRRKGKGDVYMTERCSKCERKLKDKEVFSIHNGLNPHFNLCQKCELKWDKFRKEKLKMTDSKEKWSQYIRIFLNNNKEVVEFT